MANYITERELADKLILLMDGRSQRKFADDHGIHPSEVSKAMNGIWFCPKLLTLLGYRRTRQRFYEPDPLLHRKQESSGETEFQEAERLA